MAEQAEQPTEIYGPRQLTFFHLVLKTFAGLVGGSVGTAILLVIFLAASSVLQPVLGGVAEGELAAGETSPLFMVVLMVMVFTTSVASSLISTLLICYTERERYNRIATTMTQIFIMNFVIFAFVVPIYLTTSTTSISLTAYAAGLHIILSATASALILELIHETRYPLLPVYTTLLAILGALGVNFFLFFITGNATVLFFAALPVIWTSIGFSQAALTIFYRWLVQTWGTDFLASSVNYGADYGVPEEREDENKPPDKPDVEGGQFLQQ